MCGNKAEHIERKHQAERARAKNYRAGITWLAKAGVATKVPRISTSGIPLQSYADDKAFELFLVDVGLLGAMVQLGKEANPEVNVLRFSLSGCRKQDWMTSVPLYAIASKALWG